MREIVPPEGCQQGRYRVVAVSATAASEWNKMAKKIAESTRYAYNRLSHEPLSRYPGRQNPLRGKSNQPFWELEVGSAYRVIYAVDLTDLTIIVGVCHDVHSGAKVANIISKRGSPAKSLELSEER